jgi:hypothetical protein
MAYDQAKVTLQALNVVITAITVGFAMWRIRMLRSAEHRSLLQGNCVKRIGPTTRRMVWVWIALMFVIPGTAYLIGEIIFFF